MGDLNSLIRDLLESPTWVILTFTIVYTIIVVILVWKISSWYKGISGWNKYRASEKGWKEKVKNLEQENSELREKLNKVSSSSKK